MTALVAAATVAGCSGGDDGDGGTNPAPTISITVAPATATVTQGGNTTVNVTLTRAGGFTGDVALTVEGLPTGVTAAAAPATLGSSVTSSVITLTATATAATGTANLTVRATGTGVTAATGAVALTVNAAPTYTLAATAATVTQGATGTSTITITRTGGFADNVTLAAENLPTGVTAAFAPNNTNTNGSVLTLTAAANATVGTSTVTVRGTATGQTAKTATFQLTVSAAGGAPTYTLAATAATVAAGATGTSNITITRTGGFADDVTLAATGLPTGVTAAFNPTTTGTNASVLTFTAAANAAAGTSTVTVTGTAQGQTAKTTTLQLTVTAAAGSFTVAVTEPTVTAAQGATGTANITITRTGGFADAVALTAENLPTGVTASFNPASVTGTTSVLTLTVAANAPAASATILVRGISGQQNKSATFLFTVTAAAGNFTLALNPTTLNVQQGGNGNTTVTITRTNNFAGTVNLTATGLPNGVTAAFNPAAATGNTSTLTLTASGTATVGQATVTVRGNATGLAEQTATLTLNVTATGGGSGNTTWEFCTASQTPVWMAIQDGVNGTWTRVTPTGTKFQFNITQAKGGVAFVTGESSGSVASANRSLAGKLSGILQQELRVRNRLTNTRPNAYAARSAVDGFQLSIFYGSQQELNASGGAQCLPGAGKTVNGSVTGLGLLQTGLVSLGPSTEFATSTTPAFQLTDVPDGALDLIASRLTINQTTFSFAMDKVILRRAQNFANNATMPALDFGAAEAFDPVQPNLTIGNLNGEVAYAASLFFTSAGSNSTGAPLIVTGSASAGPFKYFGIPSNKLINGDLHLVFGSALPTPTSTDQSRSAGIYFKEPTDRTVTLGPALTLPTVSAAATSPYVRFRATAAIQASYNKNVNATFTQSNTTTYRQVGIWASEAYLSGLANYDFTIPDFTGVAGWDNNWGPKAGVQTSWTVTGTGFTGVGFGTSNPLEGSTFMSGTRSGTITP